MSAPKHAIYIPAARDLARLSRPGLASPTHDTILSLLSLVYT